MRFSKPNRPIKIMEVCGTHTMAIARSGIKSLLPDNVQLISGPGCPVCVTPSSYIDTACKLAEDPNKILCSYGDMLKVPGSQGQSLHEYANVRICLSCMEALEIAKKNPSKDILFLGVGFETTAPGSALCIKEAKKQKLQNFYFLSALKRTQPAMEAVLEAPDTQIDGFLCPGHVAVILGETSFSFLPKTYHKPGVICGFEEEDLLISIEKLIQMIDKKTPKLENTYTRAVKKKGNPAALSLIEEVFESRDSLWRGLGLLKQSGLQIRKEYEAWDAWKHFDLEKMTNKEPAGCRCADILCGTLSPHQCPLFHKSCTPYHPVGPCMVSSEGACAASYYYEEETL
ncbi:hydrogenase formation protein HypD [uncultured Faecalicoccus sp.]|uniref:hydrogenase formation protein HypD n=1 Tax=uncultured Faecalicoccus sp. TaxID=1971760 RepID=UPI00261B9A1A|nr:hydrogenase formation protein HypD [uncultured Faecalicoccus sp.]